MILTGNLKNSNLTGNQLKNYRRKKKVLSLLYHCETLTATDITKEIGVSLPTAISLLKELESNSLVESRGTGPSKGGRKPILFTLKNDSIFVVACELGRFKAKIAIYDSHNQLAGPAVKFETHIDDEQLVDKIYSHTQSIISEYNINPKFIFGIGVAMPGLVNEQEGVNYTVKKKAFRNIKERLEQKFNTLVYVNNDARMQAYGEFVFGKAVGYNNALIINWNWGLGMGMIFNGKIYDGATGFAGELSHTKFIEDGNLCICGKRGCLETVTSVYVLLQKAREAIAGGKVSQITEKFRNREKELQVEDVIQAAKSGDEFCISLLYSVGLALGKALANTIQLMNPDIIVLGGVVSEANQYVLSPIQQAVNQYCLEQISGNTQIVVSEMWEQAGLLGVTASLFQNLFSPMY